MSKFVPVWASHNLYSEGGRKTHLAYAVSARGKLTVQTLCKRKLSLPSRGDVIPDLEKWLAGGPDEVCKLCVHRARGDVPFKGGERAWETVKPE